MSRASQARMAINSRKQAEESAIDFDDFIVEINEKQAVNLSLLGSLWRSRNHNKKSEPIHIKHTFNRNGSVIVIEESTNSISVFADEEKAEETISTVFDLFGAKLKKWNTFKPTSNNDEFHYFILKESILRGIPVALSIFDDEKEKQMEILNDVLIDIESQYFNEAIPFQQRGYISDNIKRWKSNLTAIV